MSGFNGKLVIDLFEERDKLRAEVERLTAKVAELYQDAEEQKQRIRRMGEAGDKMAEWLEDIRNLGADATLSHAWREAKEAKP